MNDSSALTWTSRTDSSSLQFVGSYFLISKWDASLQHGKRHMQCTHLLSSQVPTLSHEEAQPICLELKRIKAVRTYLHSWPQVVIFIYLIYSIALVTFIDYRQDIRIYWVWNFFKKPQLALWFHSKGYCTDGVTYSFNCFLICDTKVFIPITDHALWNTSHCAWNCIVRSNNNSDFNNMKSSMWRQMGEEERIAGLLWSI